MSASTSNFENTNEYMLQLFETNKHKLHSTMYYGAFYSIELSIPLDEINEINKQDNTQTTKEINTLVKKLSCIYRKFPLYSKIYKKQEYKIVYEKIQSLYRICYMHEEGIDQIEPNSLIYNRDDEINRNSNEKNILELNQLINENKVKPFILSNEDEKNIQLLKNMLTENKTDGLYIKKMEWKYECFYEDDTEDYIHI